MSADWSALAATLAGRLAAEAPLTLGICGPQGSGKSHLAALLKSLLDARGLTTAVLSLDDLYLPRDERIARHPLFATRGPPGAHDVALGLAILEGLRHGPSQVPRFDKPTETRTWETLPGPAAVIILEGWCVGAVPEPPDRLIEPINDLESSKDSDGSWRTLINETLAGPYQDLFDRLDRLLLLAPASFDVVVRWRTEQEAALGPRRAMTDDEVKAFVAHYERLTRWILEEMPSRADYVVHLDPWRALQDSNLQPPA